MGKVAGRREPDTAQRGVWPEFEDRQRILAQKTCCSCAWVSGARAAPVATHFRLESAPYLSGMSAAV